MFQKNCRLARAARYWMGGGGGGSTDINQMPGGFRSWFKEQPDIHSGYQFQQDEFKNFVANNPLLNAAQTNALQYNKDLPGMLAQFPGFQKQITGYQGQLSDQYNTLGGLLGAPGGPLGIAMSGGALSGGLLRNAQQQSLGLQSQGGTARTSGGLASAVINSDAARQARYNTALQQSQGLIGQQQGNITEGAGLTGQNAGLLGQQQALQTGGLNQMLGVGNAAVSQFGGLTNPILSYIQGIFGGNQQAAIAQAQANAQQNAAGSAKGGSTAGAAIGAVGSILGAVL